MFIVFKVTQSEAATQMHIIMLVIKLHIAFTHITPGNSMLNCAIDFKM